MADEIAKLSLLDLANSAVPSYLALAPDGQFVEVTHSFRMLGNMDNLLKERCTDLPVFIPNVSPGMHVAWRKSLGIMGFLQLDKLMLDTYWMVREIVNEAGVKMSEIVPVFNPGTRSPEGLAPIKTKLPWTPPLGMKIYLGVCENSPAAHLGALLSGSSRVYRICLPNIFDNGEICMGAAWRKPSLAPLDNALNRIRTTLDSTEWNYDLLHNLPGIQIFIRYDAKTMEQLPPRNAPDSGRMTSMLKYAKDTGLVKPVNTAVLDVLAQNGGLL